MDFAFVDRKVAVEYDGAGHRTAAQHARDVQRLNRLRAAGWLVIQVTATIFYQRREELAAHLLAALS